MDLELILYTTDCPKCKILEQKLKEKNLKFSIISDVEEMKKEGILSAPYLKVNGELRPFYSAITYVNSINN